MRILNRYIVSALHARALRMAFPQQRLNLSCQVVINGLPFEIVFLLKINRPAVGSASYASTTLHALVHFHCYIIKGKLRYIPHP